MMPTAVLALEISIVLVLNFVMGKGHGWLIDQPVDPRATVIC